MSGALLASIGPTAQQGAAAMAMSLNGSLDANSTSGTVTSATRTVSVPAGNSGVFTFQNYVDSGVVTTTQYSRNGGAFTGIPDGGDTVAFSNGDSIAVRTNSVGVGEGRSLSLIDKTTGLLIETVDQVYG